MAKVYPKIEIYVEELDKYILAGPAESGLESEYQAMVTLPANATDTAVVYTLVVYSNDVRTAFETTATVAGTGTAVDYYEVSDVAVYPEVIPAAGGDVQMMIKFIIA